MQHGSWLRFRAGWSVVGFWTEASSCWIGRRKMVNPVFRRQLRESCFVLCWRVSHLRPVAFLRRCVFFSPTAGRWDVRDASRLTCTAFRQSLRICFMTAGLLPVVHAMGLPFSHFANAVNGRPFVQVISSANQDFSVLGAARRSARFCPQAPRRSTAGRHGWDVFWHVSFHIVNAWFLF